MKEFMIEYVNQSFWASSAFFIFYFGPNFLIFFQYLWNLTSFLVSNPVNDQYKPYDCEFKAALVSRQLIYTKILRILPKIAVLQ